MIPSNQCFESGDSSILQRYLRLIVQYKGIMSDGISQLSSENMAECNFLIEVWRIELMMVVDTQLCTMQSNFGIVQ